MFKNQVTVDDVRKFRAAGRAWNAWGVAREERLRPTGTIRAIGSRREHRMRFGE